MSPTYVATCSCGSVKFESSRAPILQLTCHCQQCRSASKAPFTNFAFFKHAEALVVGGTAVQEFKADSGTNTSRESCAACGELIFDRTQAFPQIIGVVAERIKPPYTFEPRCHVWLESRVVETEIPEGVKRFERGMQ
jgi:hypothetical protein